MYKNIGLLKAILDRTSYSLDVTTGQRKYGGPPPNWDVAQPGPGHEVSFHSVDRFEVSTFMTNQRVQFESYD